MEESMTAADIAEGMVSLSEAAGRLRMNREKVLRRLQDGTIRGEQILGRWFVHRSELPQRAQHHGAGEESAGRE